MVSNFLRIIFQKVLYHSAMKALEKQALEKQDKILRERATLEKAGQDEISYCIRPLMAETYRNNLLFFGRLLKKFAMGFTLFLTIGCLYLWFEDGIVDASSGWKWTDELNNILVIIGCILAVWCILGLIKYAERYMAYTKYVFSPDRVYIYRFGKRNKIIDYDEIRKCISKRKIKVRKGRFEIPYEGGTIPVYTWGDEPTPAEFYQFLNAQCGTNIPEITDAENKIVREAGVFGTLCAYGVLPMWGFSAVIGGLGVLSDLGIEHSLKEMIKYFIHYFFSVANIFGILGGICLVMGIVLSIRNYFPAKKHFAKYKDIIKVSFF